MHNELKTCTVFAWRFKPEDEYDIQWQIEAVYLSKTEVREEWERLFGKSIDVIIIYETKANSEILKHHEGDSLRNIDTIRWLLPKDFGWWKDPLTHLWIAPDKFIEHFHAEIKFYNDLACSFIPRRHGWIDFVLGVYDHSVCISLSWVFDPLYEIVEWLEKLWLGKYPKVKIDEEGIFVELHTKQIREEYKSTHQGGWFHKYIDDEILKGDVVYLVVVRNDNVIMDNVFPRKSLVQTIYSSLVNAQVKFPEIMAEWDYTIPGRSKSETIIIDRSKTPIIRSTILEDI